MNRFLFGIIITLFLVSCREKVSLYKPAAPSKAEWIWYPGDFEIWRHREVSLQRNNRSSMDPPFFRLDSHYGLVSFHKQVKTEVQDTVLIRATGRYVVILDSKYQMDTLTSLIVPPGEHTIRIDVANYESLPCLYLRGKSIVSDSTWDVSCGEKKNFKAACGGFHDICQTPAIRFNYERLKPVAVQHRGDTLFADFGKETFGKIQLTSISGTGRAVVYYGESPEEANSDADCETFDFVQIPADSADSYTCSVSRAMRYARIVPPDGMKIKDLALLYEYLPLEDVGHFECSDKELTKIWEMSAYTLHLTTREFFIDGIKRDRWIWSGDATQSMLMDYYLFFDKDVVKRTLIGLRGKDPVDNYINHIVDYSYYWLISVYNYYQYTGDKEFVKFIYPRMVTLADFCIRSLNKNGLSEGRPQDWVFLDWAPFDHNGEMSAYQLLFVRSMEAMAACSKVCGDEKAYQLYSEKASSLKQKTFDIFWDNNQGLFLHNRVNNVLKKDITRYPNIFAMLFGYLNETQVKSVKSNVLENDSVLKITTPYMRFYELAALCESGAQKSVLKEMRSYWGGMMNLGATSFWEVYDPTEKGLQHLAMYGRPFGRSLCHSWGASPIYLVGRYYLGVYPVKPGFESYCIKPNLGGLEWMKGTVPVNGGKVDMNIARSEITINTTKSGGVLILQSATKPVSNIGSFTATGSQYELLLDAGKEYKIQYQALE